MRSGKTYRTVDEYLADIPEPARTTLNKMRAVIRAAAPKGATEAMSYGMPAFKYKGMLLWFAAFSKHCSFFAGSLLAPEFGELREEIEKYDGTKSAIHFPLDKPLPAGLVKKIVKLRVAMNEAKWTKAKKKKLKVPRR